MKQRKKKHVNDGRWTRDPVKEAYWRNQIALWQQSGLSIRAFCREHGVVETSFYAWRRELIIRARENGDVDEITEQSQQPPNTLSDGRGRKVAIRYRQFDKAAVDGVVNDPANARSNPFVPINLVHKRDEVAGAPQMQGITVLEIVLPGGAVLRIANHSNLQLAAELLSLMNR